MILVLIIVLIGIIYLDFNTNKVKYGEVSMDTLSIKEIELLEQNQNQNILIYKSNKDNSLEYLVYFDNNRKEVSYTNIEFEANLLDESLKLNFNDRNAVNDSDTSDCFLGRVILKNEPISIELHYNDEKVNFLVVE